MAAYKNLIFDLGDVIVHIDYPTTIAEFQKFALIDFNTIVSYSAQDKIFDLFDKGKVSAQQFRDEMKKYLRPDTTDRAIDFAWNSLIMAYPEKNFELLNELKKRYKVLALSNINPIHLDEIDRVAKQTFGVENFESFFHRAYYSHIAGYRKPEKEFYQMLIKSENINPAETFFVDDKPENVEAAKSLGLRAFQLKDRTKLFELLKQEKII